MVPTRSGRPEARVYVSELAKFLGEPTGKLLRFARSRGFLHKGPHIQGYGRPNYVTEYGAMRLIAYIRAWQSEQLIYGRTILEWRAYRAEAKRREYARKKLAAKQLAVVAGPDGEK